MPLFCYMQKLELIYKDRTICAKLTRRSKNRVNVKVSADGVEISAPLYASIYEIEKAIEGNLGWIFEKFDKYQDIIKNMPVLSDEEIFYKGEIFKIINVPLFGHRVIIDEDEKSLSTGVRLTGKRLISWYKEQAQFYFPQRLRFLALKHGFQFNKVTLRAVCQRWGSCSSDKNISLNSKLILAPVWVSDAILIHELVHTVIMNHSSNFYYALNKAYPMWNDAKNWLKDYSLLISKIWA